MEKKRVEINKKDTWDLTRFIDGEVEFNKIMKETETLLEEAKNYKGKIMENSESFYNYLLLDEKLDRNLSNLYVYANLLCDEDSTNNDSVVLKMKAEKFLDDASEILSFASPEILSSGYDKAKEYIKENKNLEKYKFAIEKMFRYEKYTLSEKEEELISVAANAFGTPDEAFYSLDNTDIDLGTIKDDEKEVVLTNSNYNVYVTSSNRKTRENAFKAMYKFWEKHIHVASSLLKGNIKENFFFSKVRGYNSPLEMSLYKDNIPLSLYKNVINVTHDNFKYLHEYMKIRKKYLKLDEMHMYDIYTPITKDIDKKIPFEEGKKIVIESLKPLGDTYITDLEKAFTDRWIDKYPNIGKKSGAYQWSTYDSAPYVLLNYNDTIDSVSTMAHELGHAMHSYYSKKNQSYTYHNYPIFLAEIASTVNEVLLNEYLTNNAKDEEEKKFYIVDMLDKIRTTIYRQVQFAEFEMIMHDKEASKIPLTAEEFNKTYYELNKSYYGDNIISDEEIKYEWARIPHFYDSFYVYKYATGLACAIHIATKILKDDKNMKEKYFEFLSSGGKNYPLEILKEVGIDLNSNEVMQSAFDLFKEKLEELKNI